MGGPDPPEFIFNVKVFSLLTGHPIRRNALPDDLAGLIDPEHRDKQRLYASHLPEEAVEEAWRRFHAGKLGTVLLQYWNRTLLH